jgi:hypothetical protein
VLFLGCVAPGQAAAATGFRALNEDQMDGVTAAELRMDLDLSATAQGPAAVTSTTGNVAIARTTGVRIKIDPTAPAEARVTLVGSLDLEIGLATGKAQAVGANGAQCSAAPTITGADYTYQAQYQNFTPTTATCACTVMAVGIVSP